MEQIRNQTATIELIKELFSEMCSSRRSLKPILTEIVKALDDNLFVDADSEEVKDLLEHIVRMQARLSEFDGLRGVAATKNVGKLETAITDLDNKNTVNEMKAVLLRFRDLTCKSDDVNVIEDAKKLQRQAHKLYLRADKMNIDEFIAEGKKFSDLAAKLDDPSKVSSTVYVEMQKVFPDIALIGFALIQKLFSLSKEEEPPEPIELPDDTNEFNEQIEAIAKKIKACSDSITQLITTEADFIVESAEVKKKLSLKSFNNKLGNLIEGSKADCYQLLRNFCVSRVFSIDKLDGSYEFNGYNQNPMVPTVCEKLFQWGAVNKVHWRELSFYYLNDFGYELVFKFLPSKEGRPPQRKSLRKGILPSIRRFIFMTTFNQLGIDKKNYLIDGDAARFWIRTKIQRDGKLRIHMALSLMMLDEEHWSDQIFSFISNVEIAIENGGDLRAVFLITTLDVKALSPWFKLFKKDNVKNVFAIKLEGRKATYYDIDSDLIEFNDVIRYLHGNEFDTFAGYKSKYIKKTRGRGRKKATVEASADIELEKTEATEKGKRGTKSKKSEKATSAKKKTASTETPAEDDASSTLSLFNAPSAAQAEIETLPVEETLSVEETIPVDETVDETVAVDDTPVDDTTVDDTSIADEIATVVPDIEDDTASRESDALFSIGSTALDNKFAIDDEFIRGLMRNAIALFLKGSAARGMLELHIFRFRDDLKHISTLELPAQSLDWLDGLTKLTGAVLDDPFLLPELKEIIPLEYCDRFFDRPTPFEELDAEYIKSFFAATFLIKESYAPDMNGIYELSNRQSQFLSDKSNAALKLCPSIKKLIMLFKDFTEQRKSAFATSLHTDYAGVQAQFKAAMSLIQNARGRAELTLRDSNKHPRVKLLSKQIYDADGVIGRKLELKDAAPDKLLDFCRPFMVEEASLEDERQALDDDLFSEQKVGAYLDRVWDKIKVDLHKGEKFTGVERVKQVNAFIQVLTALSTYAVAKKKLDATGDGSPAPIGKAIALIDKALDESNALLKGIKLNHIGPALLLIFLKQLKSHIEEKTLPPFYRECLLGARYIELTSTGLPDADNIGAFRYAFVCRVLEYENALGEQSTEEAVQAACETAVRSYDLGVFARLEENYREQLNLSDDRIKQIRAAALNQVGRRLDILQREFLHKLELDRHYARLSNPVDIDYYVTAVEAAKHHFEETKNAGLFERFINAINVGIAFNSAADANKLRARLDSIEDQAARRIVERLIEDGRLNVAEDYINEGGAQVGIASRVGLDEFLDGYELIFGVCVKNKNEPLEKILVGLKRDLNDINLREFADTWQNISSKPSAIPNLLRHLSFEVATLDPISKRDNNQLEFHATLEESTYEFPFDIFNTRTTNDGLDFVYMPYNLTLDQLIDSLQKLERRCSTVCLLNMALSLAERRQLAQYLKLRAELKNIIVIDRVLAVYLTAFEHSERRQKLLSAALPFANVNPYVDSPTEIFIGREKELEALSDINGATFLVGGRQIGKTALLEQLIKLEHKPSEGFYVLKAESTDTEALRADMVKRLNSDGVKKLILIIDNNKTFASSNSKELEPFVRLREEFSGRFKFIVTAHHTSASNDDAIKLKPFTPEEAARFMVEPLNILGFKTEDENILRSIWVQANYYPGLLNYYCGKIIEAVADNYELKKFYATKNPAYDFDDEFLQNMLRRHELHEELNRRLTETLRDEQEEYYYVLMLAIAYSIYDDGKQAINFDRIRDMFVLHEIYDWTNLTDDVTELLLEEMCELKLLRQTGDRYEFYRSAFRYLFGDDDNRIEALLKECAARHKTRKE